MDPSLLVSYHKMSLEKWENYWNTMAPLSLRGADKKHSPQKKEDIISYRKTGILLPHTYPCMTFGFVLGPFQNLLAGADGNPHLGPEKTTRTNLQVSKCELFQQTALLHPAVDLVSSQGNWRSTSGVPRLQNPESDGCWCIDNSFHVHVRKWPKNHTWMFSARILSKSWQYSLYIWAIDVLNLSFYCTLSNFGMNWCQNHVLVRSKISRASHED